MNNNLLDANDDSIFDIQTNASGPQGKLPLTDDMLRSWSSGDLFGLTQAAGMGWKPEDLLGPQYLLLSTQGGVRAPDGQPIALDITQVIGKSACSSKQLLARSSKRAVCPSQPSAVILAMVERRERPACSTAYRIETMPP